MTKVIVFRDLSNTFTFHRLTNLPIQPNRQIGVHAHAQLQVRLVGLSRLSSGGKEGGQVIGCGRLVSGVPQLPQKRKAAGFSKSQLGQMRASRVPHMPQKRMRGGLSKLQLQQNQ
jgi:hypothetical protein